MILTKFDTFTGKSEIAAKGTAKDNINYLSKLAEIPSSLGQIALSKTA